MKPWSRELDCTLIITKYLEYVILPYTNSLRETQTSL